MWTLCGESQRTWGRCPGVLTVDLVPVQVTGASPSPSGPQSVHSLCGRTDPSAPRGGAR